MHANVLFLIFLSTFTFVIGAYNFDSSMWYCADYYWRDYHGFIPHDAVPAGNDRYGNPRYIGITYIRKYEYLPCQILPDQQICQTTAYTFVLNTTDQVKILCGPCLSAFEWIPTESKDLHMYTSTRPAIPGGSEVGEDLYIGRVFRNNDAIVGKVFRDDRPGGGQGIWFPLDGKPANSLTYELLVYNCHKVCGPKVDLRSNCQKKDRCDRCDRRDTGNRCDSCSSDKYC